MGKTRKGFNWKARSNQGSSGKANLETEQTVELDFDIKGEKYDSCNTLLLQGKKARQEQCTEKKNVPNKAKPLSKKQKRRLSKMLEKKKKNLNRSDLLEKLQKVQATSDELKFMTSTSSMQTFGLKKHPSAASSSDPSVHCINSVRGSKRRVGEDPKMKRTKLDPNVVGFDEDSDDVSSDNEDSSDHSEDHDVQIVPCPRVANGTSTNNTLLVTDSDTAVKSSSSTNESMQKTEENNPSDVPRTISTEASASSKVSYEPATFVPVIRSPDIQAVREALPIYSEEQGIIEAVRENSVVVIHGATGSGKTTQVPQFLYEAGYTRNKKLIGITEPRRIAAVQMASRVAEEMNLPDAVSYQIRYEKTATDDKTEIKFMTDGVLMKEIRTDFLLSRYSVIIIDEAHERSVFSDILIGLLSRILPLREKKGNPLKLIIMSATLRVENFTENPNLFKTPPILITLDSRQYDVVLHFNTKTPADYVQAAYDKVCKIHRQLPSGAILVFVTGEKEVTRLCRLLRKAFPFKEHRKTTEGETANEELPEFANKKFKKQRKKKRNESFVEMPKIDLDDYSIEPLDSEGIQHQHSDDEDNPEEEELSKVLSFANFDPLYVLPLYSVLPTEEQAKIFKPPPSGCRLCVVATNVAETSVTIPGLKYVVDSGKVKTRVYDKFSCGISSFNITWISKASANQRAGRAGRTEGGHCYRLYSSSVFEHEFPEFARPDIQRIPVDDMLLQMKALGIDRVVNFPFPSAPDQESLKAAEKRLVTLGALQDLRKDQNYKDVSKWEYSAKITPLGKAISRFPLSPRYAKMLLLSYKHDIIAHVVAIVSAMTVPEVFLNSEVPNSESNPGETNSEPKYQNLGITKIGAGKGKSLKLGDAMVLLRTVAAYEEAQNKSQFCSKYHIRKKAMLEIQKMRLQLIREMNRSFYDLKLSSDLLLNPPTENEIEKLRKILASSMTDHVARRVPAEVQKEAKYKNAYTCLDLEEAVFIHPSSILSKHQPEFVIYQEIFQTTKYFMRTVTEIEPEWLTAFAPNQCIFSEPLEKPPPYYDSKADKLMCSMTATFGRSRWDLPCVVMPMLPCVLKYSYFCFYLLDGEICHFFKAYKKILLSTPSVMLKQWARLLPRTRLLLQAIMDKDIDSKETLLKVWKSNPKYLLQEYCDWLPEDMHMEIACKWPPSK